MKRMMHMVVLALVLMAAPAWAQQQRSMPFYLGVDGLLNQLAPDEGRAGSPPSSTGGGAAIALGYDLSNRFSVELAYTAMGRAELEEGQNVDYSALTLGAVLHAFGNPSDIAVRNGRWGWFRLGGGRISRDTDIQLAEDDDVAIWVGAGFEWSMADTLAARAEWMSLASDAQALKLGLIWRPGNRSSSVKLAKTAVGMTPPAAEPDAMPEHSAATGATGATGAGTAGTAGENLTPAAERAAPAGRPRPVPVPARSAAERAAAALQAPEFCEPPISPADPADEHGCGRIASAAGLLSFQQDQAQLRLESAGAIATIVRTLQANPLLQLEIAIYSDSGSGDNDRAAALSLSRDRARALAGELNRNGIALTRLAARAWAQPAVGASGQVRLSLR